MRPGNACLVPLWMLLIAGCTAQPQARAPVSDPPIAIAVAPPLPETTSVHVASVVRAYREAERREVPAVVAPTVTPDFVRRVHTADLDARHAVQALEQEGRQPTKEALLRARAAVTRLSAILAEPPGESGQ